MIRALAGSALLLSALGLVAVLLGPSLSIAPGGKPMVVQGAEFAGVQQASFNVDECFPARLLSEPPTGAHRGGVLFLAITFQDGPDGLVVQATDASTGDAAGRRSLIVVLGASGEVLAASPVDDWSLAELELVSSGACPAATRGEPGLI